MFYVLVAVVVVVVVVVAAVVVLIMFLQLQQPGRVMQPLKSLHYF